MIRDPELSEVVLRARIPLDAGDSEGEWCRIEDACWQALMAQVLVRLPAGMRWEPGAGVVHGTASADSLLTMFDDAWLAVFASAVYPRLVNQVLGREVFTLDEIRAYEPQTMGRWITRGGRLRWHFDSYRYPDAPEGQADISGPLDAVHAYT